jgi:hypothetical protein
MHRLIPQPKIDDYHLKLSCIDEADGGKQVGANIHCNCELLHTVCELHDDGRLIRDQQGTSDDWGKRVRNGFAAQIV